MRTPLVPGLVLTTALTLGLLAATVPDGHAADDPCSTYGAVPVDSCDDYAPDPQPDPTPSQPDPTTDPQPSPTNDPQPAPTPSVAGPDAPSIDDDPTTPAPQPSGGADQPTPARAAAGAPAALPRTGSGTTTLFALGATLLTIGGLLVAATRRRLGAAPTTSTTR